MNNTILKSSIFATRVIATVTVVASALVTGTVVMGTVAMADTVTGNLSTGISATNGTTVNGVVVVPPTANPSAGVYTSAQSVTLTASGASSIYYTTDGLTDPTCSTGTLYSGAIAVGTSEPIEAIACYVDSSTNTTHPSTVASYLYAINPPSGSDTTVTGSVNSNVSGGSGGVGFSSSGGGGGSSGGSLFSKGDANLDGKINILDFVILMADWGKTGTGIAADFKGDGKVDIQDFVTLMANWTN